jgi:hypothetical protein
MRTALIATLLLSTTALLAVPTSSAQEFDRPESNQFLKERTMIETILGSIVDLVSDAANLSSTDNTRARLTNMTDLLKGQSASLASAKQGAPAVSPDLEETLREALAEIISVRSDLSRKGDLETSQRLEVIEDLIENALLSVQDIGEVQEVKKEIKKVDQVVDQNQTIIEKTDNDGFLKPGTYEDGVRLEDRRSDDDDDDNDRRWWNDDDEDRETWRDSSDSDWQDWRSRRWDDSNFIETYVGDFTHRWPFRENATYRTMPAVRYNRVEGLVLGIRRKPLEWDSYEKTRVYGMGGYAFGSDDWQYEIGAEARAGKRYGQSSPDFIVGGSYRRSTYTNDLWKSNYAENSLAAFFFNYDFFDYFMTEGWSAYASVHVNQYFQVSAAYRDEDYSSLEQNITWSLFGGDHFRFNFPIDEGNIQSVYVTVDGGKVSGLNHLPDGVAFRGEAEFGQGLGDNYSFNRYTGDLRAYMRTGYRSSLGVRLRGGIAEGDEIPIQKMFTIGGIGSVRAYPQNAFLGERIVVANAEYAMVQNWLWDELLIAGFFDAGWTSTPTSNSFKVDDMFKTVGVSLGLFDRAVRLDLAFPLDDFGGDKDPTLWLRLTPAF